MPTLAPRPQVRRRKLLLGGLAALAGAAGSLLPAPVRATAAARSQLVVSGPGAIVSAPLIEMLARPGLAPGIATLRFQQWRDPDQLRLLALEGQADLVAMPTSVAANLYNRGAPVQLLNVSTWGVLWLVSRDAGRHTLADFRGEEIAVPFRGDMPDLMLQLLAKQQGYALRKEFRLRYVATPLDAMQLLLTRQVRHALLAEPAVSMVLHKTRSLPASLVAPELHRGADLQQEWGQAFGRAPRLPQAGLVAVGRLRHETALLKQLLQAHHNALHACRQDALACGQRMAAQIEPLSAAAVADAIAVSQLDAVPATAARAELEFLFERLLALQPAVIGGRLPDAGFYASTGQA